MITDRALCAFPMQNALQVVEYFREQDDPVVNSSLSFLFQHPQCAAASDMKSHNATYCTEDVNYPRLALTDCLQGYN